MGKLAIYKYVSFMFLVVSATLTILTIAGLFGGKSSPATNHGLAMLVYVLPFLIGANIVMLIYWLVRRRWIWSVMPVFSILSCVPYIGTIYQFRFSTPTDYSKAGINIATYNVAMFGRETSGFKSGDILSAMKSNNVDILCMQEYSDACGDRLNSDNYKEYFPYYAFGRDDMIIYSRFPISQSQVIDFGETNNSAMWADVVINEKTFRVFNVHLETTGFNRTMRKVAKMELQGQTITENAIIKAIYGNYTMGMVVRARQSQLVAEVVDSCMLPTIVCGDFNDVPYSYTYRTMLGENLVDGFKECGSGFMSTYRGRKKARIDYIFHDKSLKGQRYYKEDLSYSDHDPVFMKIAL